MDFDTLTDATAIGANALVNTNNSLILGNSVNVGIGTSSPDALLNVSGGDVLIDRKTTTQGLTRTLTIGGARNGSGNPFAQLNFQNLDNNGDNADCTGARIESQNADAADDGDLRFATNNGTLTTHMIITPGGNVGINELDPSENLVVGEDIGGYAGARITVGNATGFIN